MKLDDVDLAIELWTLAEDFSMNGHPKIAFALKQDYEMFYNTVSKADKVEIDCLIEGLKLK